MIKSRHRKHRNGRRFLSFREYLTIFEATPDNVRQDQYEAMKSLKCPAYLCGRTAPENLNLISYGQLDDLHDTPEGVNAIVNCCKVILGVDEPAIMAERADRILGFVAFCNKEVKRINKLFASISPDFEPEEKMAGIEKLRFGSFGILDWYSRRMGITDQDEVRRVPWVRIWQCMRNDNETGKYEKRLRAVYKRQNKIRKK